MTACIPSCRQSVAIAVFPIIDASITGAEDRLGSVDLQQGERARAQCDLRPIADVAGKDTGGFLKKETTVDAVREGNIATRLCDRARAERSDDATAHGAECVTLQNGSKIAGVSQLELQEPASIRRNRPELA